ncbi:MAG: gamma-glutamyltransferase family protein [Paracoccaceae bacterium]|nr:gamma-glutamyltransferase family protein [Paracoccaceae bacterium]
MRDFQMPGRSTVMAMNGMCATSHPLAAKVAIETLERGGSAMDAAIAGAVLLGMCEPHMCGIGGDCFVLISKPGQPDIVALNGSGRAPAAASAAALRARGLDTVPLRGPEAVTIPGAVDAFCTLSEDHGRLGIDALLAPAIRYAEEGVPMGPRVALDWPGAAKALQGHATKHYSVDPVPVISAPAQAKALRLIAQKGRAGFYEGEVAEDLVAALREAGGIHDLADFAGQRCNYGAPVSGLYKGTELVEHAPNGQGATAILLLNILSHFDIAGMDPLSATRIHIEAEATRLAYDARNRFIADPDHTTRLGHMLAPETAARLAALIDPKQAMASAHEASEAIHKDTVYITVVDRDRMAVSLIYSLFHPFGSGIGSQKFGILLQNRGAGFTLEEGHPNEMAPGKRPMHTIIPGMLRVDGRVTMPFGVMGGAYQSTGHARFVSNMVDFGMDAQSAIDTPRAFAEGSILKVESGYSDAVRAELVEMGHDVMLADSPIGGAQSILIREDGVLEGASDPRKDGCALGY